MSMKGKKILVTGGAGFVGTALCRRLVADGNSVISLDNYFTGTRENHVSGVDYREGHTKDIAMHVPEAVDLVYHLGEYSRVEKSFEDPIEMIWELNKQGTLGVLQYCVQHSCKIVYGGSSTKFADDGTGRNQSPYAWMKATNADLVRNFHDWYGLEYAIVYFYSVYGPGQITTGPYATVVGIFLEQAAQGQPHLVTSPGTQVRNFTHIDDIIDGMILVGEKGAGDDYSIGSETPYTILDLARLCGGEVIMMPDRPGNRKMGGVHTPEKLRSLGWSARHTLEHYIADEVKAMGTRVQKNARVLVFTTTFHPIAGLAENALCDVMRDLPNVHFDIITGKHTSDSDTHTCPVPNATVYRVGYGKWYDKYLIPHVGYKKALELCTSNQYIFAWSVMASYGALAAMRVRRLHPLPLLITLADQRIDSVPWYARLMLRFILRDADQISATSALQEHGVLRYASSARITASNKKGDSFTNQIRYMYSMHFRPGIKK
jgi:UDP-glucose 4-epimerase